MISIRPKHVLALATVGLLCLVTLHNSPSAVSNILQSSSSSSSSSPVFSNQVVLASSTTVVRNAPTRRRLFTTTLPSRVGPISTSNSLWQNDYNLVNVVNTRFMQHQPSLVHLGQARLDLFKTITLPSMLQQSNQQFLWLIWTDEHLNESIMSQLVDSVKDVHNVLIIKIEQVPDMNLRSLYGLSWTSIGSAIAAGNPMLLADCYKASEDHLLVETSLDADDGLSVTFIESAQELAAASLGQDAQGLGRKMEYFCPEHHMEWRYYKPQDVNNLEGHLIHFNNKKFCINSGLTRVYHLDPESASGRQLSVGPVYQCGIAEETSDCPPTSPTSRHLTSTTSIEWANNLPNNLPTDTSKCSETNPTVPLGTQQVTPYYDGDVLHDNNSNNCPAQSTMCVGHRNGETIKASFLRTDDGSSPVGKFFFIRCIPKECTTDVVYLMVEVKDAQQATCTNPCNNNSGGNNSRRLRNNCPNSGNNSRRLTTTTTTTSSFTVGGCTCVTTTTTTGGNGSRRLSGGGSTSTTTCTK